MQSQDPPLPLRKEWMNPAGKGIGRGCSTMASAVLHRQDPNLLDYSNKTCQSRPNTYKLQFQYITQRKCQCKFYGTW